MRISLGTRTILKEEKWRIMKQSHFIQSKQRRTCCRRSVSDTIPENSTVSSCSLEDIAKTLVRDGCLSKLFIQIKTYGLVHCVCFRIVFMQDGEIVPRFKQVDLDSLDEDQDCFKRVCLLQGLSN